MLVFSRGGPFGRRSAPRRGWIAAVAAAVPTVVSTAGILSTNKKDPQRYKTAQDWYQAAVAGDGDALCALKHMSGRYGVGQCGKYGPAAGFATQAAKDYDHKVYEQALAVLNNQVSASIPLPTTPAPSGAGSVSAQTAAVLQAVSNQTAQGAAAITGQQTPQQTLNTVTTVGKWVLVLGGIGLLVFLVMRGRR